MPKSPVATPQELWSPQPADTLEPARTVEPAASLGGQDSPLNQSPVESKVAFK